MASSLLNREPTGGALVDAPGWTRGASGNLLVLYGRLLGPLLGGYLLLDRAFAYIRLPGTPLYVGEMVLGTGALGVLAATGYLRIPVRDEPILAVLAAFFLWGFIRFLPGFRAYGIQALRDFALCYYCLFAFFTVAALARARTSLTAGSPGSCRGCSSGFRWPWRRLCICVGPAFRSAAPRF